MSIIAKNSAVVIFRSWISCSGQMDHCLGIASRTNSSVFTNLTNETLFSQNEEQLHRLYRLIVDMISKARFCEHSTVAYLFEVLLHSFENTEHNRLRKKLLLNVILGLSTPLNDLESISEEFTRLEESDICTFAVTACYSIYLCLPYRVITF